MSSDLIQHLSVSPVEPILPQEYQTGGSQALNGQYNLDYHPHSQDTPCTTNGYMSAVTPDLIAGPQTPEYHCALYQQSSSTPTAASCCPFGQQRSKQTPLRRWQQQLWMQSQLSPGYEAMPLEVITSPNADAMSPRSPMARQAGQPAYEGMADSSCLKINSQVPPQLQGPQMSPVWQVHCPQAIGELQGPVNTALAAGDKSAPGPIPAITPLLVRQDENGVQWIAFEYSIEKVKMEYIIRCDVESVKIDELSPEFKEDNCVYPRACSPKNQYQRKRLIYETDCNRIAWGLAELNIPLRGRRGLIQRAVDSWRNSNQDPRLWSRRIRRLKEIQQRTRIPQLPSGASSQQPQH